MAVDTIVRVDPSTLLVGPNVRKQIELTKDFVASIKEHGVLVPITVQETPDGFDVIDGQMRTLAAVDAGLKEVPIYVSAPVESGGSRIVSQLVVNGDRQSVTGGDQVAAVKELALDFKMPVAQIVKKVGLAKEVVEQAIAVAKSPQASTAFASAGLTLEQAAKLAEHELSKADVKELTSGYGSFEHKLQQILDARAATARTKELEAEVKKAGVPLAAKPTTGDYYSSGTKNKHQYLTQLVDKVSGKPVTVEEHAACAGHAAFVGQLDRYSNKSIEIHYVCTDPAKHGHRDKNRSVPTPLTDAEKAARKLSGERAKVWPSATTVRLAWITEQLLTRKAMPAGWETIVAWTMLGQAGGSGTWNWGPKASELLQLEKTYGSGPLVKYFETHPTKSATVALTAAIAQIEEEAGGKKGWESRKVREYLTLLASWGYGLSELEQELVDELKGAKAA